MQTVQFQVEDNKLDVFLTVINNLKDGLFKNVIVKDNNELDSDTLVYMKTNKFQEDKVCFQKCLEDFDNGKTTALSHNDVWEQIDNHTKASQLNIIYEPKFVKSFTTIWDFISIDSKVRANKFKIELKDKIEDLVYMPYKFRKSIYFDDDKVRDLIFKGYVIPYRIDKLKNVIFIVGINKYQNDI